MGRKGSSAGRVSFTDIIDQSIRTRRPIWLDTMTILVYLEGGHSKTETVARLLSYQPLIFGISTLTFAEVLAGPARFGDEVSMRRLRNGMMRTPRLTISPFDVGTADLAALIRGQTRLSLPDAGIIASALRGEASCIIGNDHRWRGKSLGLPFLLLDDLVRS